MLHYNANTVHKESQPREIWIGDNFELADLVYYCPSRAAPSRLAAPAQPQEFGEDRVPLTPDIPHIWFEINNFKHTCFEIN